MAKYKVDITGINTNEIVVLSNEKTIELFNRLNSDNGHVPQPTLKCAQEKDIVTAKAGLITADEMVYAGALYAGIPKDNPTYLNNNTWFWTMSPQSSDYVCYLNNTVYSILGAMVYFGEYSGLPFPSARPVITLSADATISKGDGTLNSPYIIKVD